MARRNPEKLGISEPDRIAILNRRLATLIGTVRKMTGTINAQQAQINILTRDLDRLTDRVSDLENPNG